MEADCLTKKETDTNESSKSIEECGPETKEIFHQFTELFSRQGKTEKHQAKADMKENEVHNKSIGGSLSSSKGSKQKTDC